MNSSIHPSPLKLGLTGYPLGHSLSPRLHHAALAAMQLAGEYRLYPVAPEETGGLERLLARLRCGELHGLNVTIPHKQNVLPLLDRCSPAVERIGAANTLRMCDGQLLGENTDAAGFLIDVQRLLARQALPHGQCALVLGAGGSARAVVYALAQAGWQVGVAARRPEQAEALAAQLAGCGALYALSLEAGVLRRLAPVSLLVNTTPVGMAPNPQASPWPQDVPLPDGAAIYDLVYNPAETQLLCAGRAAGLAVANGLGMLIEQAALALEAWSGLRVPRRAMWQAVQE